VENEEDCTKKGKRYLWLDANGEDHCLYLTALNGGRGCIGGECKKDPIDCAATQFNLDVGNKLYDSITI
jgi:hypothetical protein